LRAHASFRKVWLLVTILICFQYHLPDHLYAGQGDALIPQIQHGGYALTANGRISKAHNSTTPFTPASTLKIITALAALNILGPEHHFATHFYRDEKNNLYIQGNGDPFLLTENIIAIVDNLRDTGIRKINNLIIDDSSHQLDRQADGNENTINPYDSWNSGLAVNFNAIAIVVTPEHAVKADDPKVPLLPMMQTIGAALPAGHHLVNVNAFPSVGQLSNTQRYTGELFAGLMKKQQIVVEGSIQEGLTPTHAQPVLSYWSGKSVREMLQQCLKYSNNFIANQLFLACGVAHFGPPATWDKAQRTLQSYIKENLDLSEAELTMVEGSGLSRHNWITPRAMVSVLEKFAPYKELLPLKHDIPLKSGTLSGVYCYAGYLPQQHDAPFVILLNQPHNNRDVILHTLAAQPENSTLLTAKKQKK
jgi:D-alanyl-D-alanine carboxypeptidase/D-alanyl-D-alanine-endopeptidase (penicillin-binding protein 4)